MSEQRAVIVGAGIGGLTAAIALRRIGVEATVYERAAVLGEVGSGITLWPNATRILLALGLEEVVHRGQRFPGGTVRTPDGRVLSRSETSRIEAQMKAPCIAIHRAELHALLAAAIPSDAIHLGHECVDVHQSGREARVRFSNGRTAAGDLLIGADGIRSAVRRLLFPEVATRYAGYTVWRGVADLATDAVSETWGRGARFGIVPLREDRTYWFAVRNARAGMVEPDEARGEAVKRLFSAWHDPIPRLIAATPPQQILHNDIYDITPFTTWSRGHAVLLGDAAHPTTPNLGQGACMAIESAFVLAEELQKRGDVAGAIAAYEKRRMRRTAKVTSESWRIGRIAQTENALLASLRDLLIRAIPPSVTERQIASVVAAEI